MIVATKVIAPGQDSAARARARVAVLLPCYNEEITIAEVVAQFRAELPDAAIYVFDNNSTDRTAERAQAAGAILIKERRQGKGYVVQSMFRQIDADIYVMADGDGTYAPSSVHQLIAPVLQDEADMVVGSRLHTTSQSQFRRINRLGNRLILSLLNAIFRVRLTDILSGYRAFNHNFVKGLPLFGGGFEIETELTIKAIERGYRVIEVPIDLGARPAGSHSKIQIVRDGLLILNTILALFRDYKPLTFFGAAGLILLGASLIPGLPVVFGFTRAGSASHLIATILSVGLMLSGLFSISVGLILHTIARRSQEFEHHLRVLRGELRRDMDSAPAAAPSAEEERRAGAKGTSLGD